jgi:hypothetical protein
VVYKTENCGVIAIYPLSGLPIVENTPFWKLNLGTETDSVSETCFPVYRIPEDGRNKRTNSVAFSPRANYTD